nr:MAG TPA: hypothetical protein [Caudoviricetes sp.]
MQIKNPLPVGAGRGKRIKCIYTQYPIPMIL